MTGDEELCCSMLDDAVVTRSAVTGGRRGRRVSVAFGWRAWEVATPVELRDRACRLYRVPLIRPQRRELEGLIEVEGEHYEAVCTPSSIVRDAFDYAQRRPGWISPALRERLHFGSFIAERGTACAIFPYHYYRFDRELLDASIDLVVALGEALERVGQSEGDTGELVADAPMGGALVPYRDAALARREIGPPVAYLKAAKQLTFKRALRRNRGWIILVAYLGFVATMIAINSP